MADTTDLKSVARIGREGSSPSSGTSRKAFINNNLHPKSVSQETSLCPIVAARTTTSQKRKKTSHDTELKGENAKKHS
jgi:hypothetical protein